MRQPPAVAGWPCRQPRCPPRRGARLALRLLLAAVAAAPAPSHPAPPPPDGLQRLTQAERRCGLDTVANPVTLPDRPAPGAAGPLVCHYRLHGLQPGRSGEPMGLFVPGLVAHASVRLNGVLLHDGLGGMPQPVPRSLARIVLLPVPAAAWHSGADAGANELDIEAAGPKTLALSTITLGPLPVLAPLQRRRMLGVVIGPAVVAAVVGTLGLCMLLIWYQRRDPLFGYFGAGTLGWALHDLWSVSPWPLLTGPAHAVMWTSLTCFYVAMLVVFCLRFSDAHWPRFEQAVRALVPATPLLLLAAVAVGWHDGVDEGLRLLLLGLVGAALAAVLRALWRQPNLDRLLVAGSGAVGLGLGAHDWLLHRSMGDDNPVYLAPYAGLPFAVSVVRLLIGRFTQATAQLALLNAGLSQQVQTQTAALRAANATLRLARDAAEAADQAKTRFLAAASHDLRQPAHALALYMAALQAQPLNGRQADLVQRMSGSLAALETMFNLLLDLSRIDAGAMTPQPCRFDIGPLLRLLADEHAPQAEARGLRLALHLPRPDEPANVLSDPGQVERILRNLLSNAVKYTRSGGILLACRARHTAAGVQWRVEVWDSGIGIADADQQRIFEPFFQVDNPGRDRAQGMGLGLSIVQRLVRQLGLTLELQSRPGRGSRFALMLPQAEAAALATATGGQPALQASAQPALPRTATPATRPPPALAGMVVGLIEDDSAVCAAMQTLLDTWGCTLLSGADADGLHAACRSHGRRPQALVVDHRLRAGSSGPEQAQQLCARWRQHLPVLLVSGESDLQALRGTGLDCMLKPVAPALLAQWLATARLAQPMPWPEVAP